MISKSVQARAHTRSFAIGIDYITEHTHQRARAEAARSFDHGIGYASAPGKAAWVQLRGVTSVETAAIEMEGAAALSRRCPDPVYHLIVAYAKGEHPTREQVVSDAERLLKAIGMERNQYVLAAHQDTDDYHAHVIANRIGPDGKANDLWRERIIRERVCAEIAAERRWEIVVGHHNGDIVQRVRHLYAPPEDPERRLSDGAYRGLRERGELPWQESARPYVLDAVDRATDWSDLHRRLVAHGVIAKLVQRGGRVRGLAFAEGLERHAPGCAASRIDARCALPALERHFGPFRPSREPVREVAPSAPWIESARATILSAVDASTSWDELAQRLDRDDIVIKLIKRGARVQGLAFAAGREPGAPGCGASRIHPRCKKAALEQRFGTCPYEPQQPSKRSHAKLRDRAEREAQADPRWALRDAQRIVDQARMRSEYAGYRKRFFDDRQRAQGARRDAAWVRERAQRARDARRRREARLFLRAVARLSTRGVIARQLAYWSTDIIMARRRARDYDTARVRWETTKIVLASERKLAREEKPMTYQPFVAQRAQAGNLGAQRILRELVTPARQAHTPEREVGLRRMSLGELRAQLNVVRAAEGARYERTRAERRALEHVERPPTLEEALSAERRRIADRIAATTKFNEGERMRLAQLSQEQRSWNPLTRMAASKREADLHAEQRSRSDRALEAAMRDFDHREVPQIERRLTADQRRYRKYASESITLEREMNEARSIFSDQIPRIVRRVDVLERIGVSHVEVLDIGASRRFGHLSAAIEQQYRTVPETIRRDAEHAIRKEQRAREWSRDSMSMDR